MSGAMSFKRYVDFEHTWTEQVIADGVADDEAVIINCEGASHIYCEWDTNGATTNAPDFDFHLESSQDKSTFTDTHYATLASAVAKDKVGSCMVTPGPPWMKALLDVNTANLVATEFVTLKVRVFY